MGLDVPQYRKKYEFHKGNLAFKPTRMDFEALYVGGGVTDDDGDVVPIEEE